MEKELKSLEFKKIPIFIISFNRLKDLQQLIYRLELDGYTNLHVVDNASTDKALHDYLKQLPYKVYFLKKNYGHMVVWKSGLFQQIINTQYYVVTDPDIVPIEECPDDYLEYFFSVLQQYPRKVKVGFSLKIDDLPDTFRYKMDVIRWESLFYDKKICTTPLLFDADIDTTFALYRPGMPASFFEGIRTGYPYAARHLDWYVDVAALSKENEVYLQTGASCGGSFLLEHKVQRLRVELFEKLKERESAVRQVDIAEVMAAFCIKCRHVYVYGTGKRGTMLANLLQKRGIVFQGFLVSQLDNQNEKLLGHSVWEITQADVDSALDGIVLGMSWENELFVLKNLYGLGYMKILAL